MKSSMLVFLTILEDEVHKIIFLHQRELDVNYPNNTPYWYSDCVPLYGKDNLFGWCCIGKETQVKSIKDSIKSSSNISINKNFYRFEKLISQTDDLIVRDDDDLEGTQGIFSQYQMTLSKASESLWMNQIASRCSLLLERTFCNHISGIKQSEHHFGVLVPQGFWGEDELYKYFEDHVVDVNESLIPFITFKGTGDLRNKELTGFAGTCQQFPSEWNDIEIQFYDLDQNLAHSEEFSLTKGLAAWNATFRNAPPKGIVKVVKEAQVIGASKYYLLLDINVDVKAYGGGELFQDAYGRNFAVGKKEPDSKALEVINWNPDFKLKPQLLSDELVRIFSQLGKRILIQDPYLIGDISDGKTTQGTVGFFNSLMITILNYHLEEITFLVDPTKIKSKAKKDLKGYLLNNFKALTEKGLRKIEIAWSEATFHDRYFLSLSNEYLYHASKSVNGFLESEDLNISLKKDEQTKRLKAQILYRLNKSKKENVLG